MTVFLVFFFVFRFLFHRDGDVAIFVEVYVEIVFCHTGGGYFYGKDFISLLGLPYFGTVSTDREGGIFDYMRTGFLMADYSRPFGKAFALGAQAGAYYAAPGTLTLADGTRTPAKAALSYTFGVYIRANLSFLLKKFGKRQQP